MSEIIDKEFKTYSEKITILTQRGLIIDHPRFFINAIKSDDYYNVINGYKKYFIATMNPEQYFKGVTFEQVYSLYLFDKELRKMFICALVDIEKKVKSTIAYCFSKKYGYDHRQYLNSTNFNDSTTRNRQNADKLILDIRNDVSSSERKGNSAICHYLNKYRYIPVWVLNTILSFGRMANFYHCMKLKDQQEISSAFKLSAAKMDGFLRFLNYMRNVCAHGGRIYTPNNNTTHLKFIPDTQYHTSLNIPRNRSGNFIYGKSGVLAMLIAFKIFLKKSDFTNIRKGFIKLEKALEKEIPNAIMNNIEKEMGFPSRYLPML